MASFADLGTGTIYFARISSTLENKHYHHYLVERDTSPHSQHTARSATSTRPPCARSEPRRRDADMRRSLTAAGLMLLLLLLCCRPWRRPDAAAGGSLPEGGVSTTRRASR